MNETLQSNRRALLVAAALSPALALAASGVASAATAAGGLPVIAELVAKPEYASQVRDAMTRFSEHTRSEPGCLHYALYEDSEAPGHFYTIELWTDAAALNAHLTSPTMKAAGPKFAPLLMGPPAIHPLTQLSA